MQLRLAFPIAFLMLLGGVLGSRWIFSTLSGAVLPHAPQQVAARTENRAHVHGTSHPGRHVAPHRVKTSARLHRASAATRPSLTPRPAVQPSATALPTAAPSPTAAPLPTTTPLPVKATVRRVAPVAHATQRRQQGAGHIVRTRRHLKAVRRKTPAPRATPRPTPTPTTGTIALTNYYITSASARTGQTVSVVYTIDNGTGRTARIMLGASIKSRRAGNWGLGAINDPEHDVVAIAPPGISTHLRYFTLASTLRPGTYDVGWGLRDAGSGRAIAFLAAQGALRVVR